MPSSIDADHATSTMLTAPEAVAEWELTSPVPTLPAATADGRPYASVHLLVRRDSQPLGVVVVPLPSTPEQVLAIVAAHLAGSLPDRPDLRPEGIPPRPGGAWLTGRRRALEAGPSFTVVVCTRGREARLPEVLRQVTSLDHPRFDVVVVDNVPQDDTVERLVKDHQYPVPVHHVVERRPGLSWARNAGWAAASGDVIAFLDDDEAPDRHWLAEYARAFTEVPGAGVASGMILPRSLDTPAERVFEQLGGHSKGRAWRRVVFDQASHRAQHPLYPLPPFGAGGNMAFRRETLRVIGGFDVALGAGTPGRGGEDTAAIADAMLAGFTMVWEPAAFVRHGHYSTLDGAHQQLRGYGIGLTAFYTRMVLADPRRLVRLARLAPRAVVDLALPGSVRNAPAQGVALPSGLSRQRLIGMAAGPAGYLRSRRIQARLGDGGPPR